MPAKVKDPLNAMGRKQLNQLSGESARGTKVDMKQKFGNIKSKLPKTQRIKAFGGR
jgi:hypothetical protein